MFIFADQREFSCWFFLSNQFTAIEQAQKLLEEKRKAEEAIRQAEEEFMWKHREEKKVGKDSGPPRTTSVSSLAKSDAESDGRKRGLEKDGSPGKTNKKKNEVEDEEDEETFGEDPVKNLDIGVRMLDGWLRQPNIARLVTKPQQRKFEKILGRVREEVVRCREEMARMETKVEERSSLVEVVKKTVRDELDNNREVLAPGMSYAAALGRKELPKVPKVTGVKGPVQPAPKLVIVRHESKECEEVKSTLKKLVKPAQIGLRVIRMINIRNGVIVEAESEEGAANLENCKVLRDAGLTVEKPKKKRPVIMVYDVSAGLKDEEIKEEIYSRNLQNHEIEEEEFRKEFDVKHRYNDARSSGKRCHIVAECTVRVRNWLRARDKIFIEWQSCRVKDYVDVARCYKCQRFGHIAKHCTGEKSGCSFCAGEHEYKDCPDKNKKDKVCCINCRREKRVETKHDAGWRGCPVFEKAVKRQNERIDYGM